MENPPCGIGSAKLRHNYENTVPPRPRRLWPPRQPQGSAAHLLPLELLVQETEERVCLRRGCHTRHGPSLRGRWAWARSRPRSGRRGGSGRRPSQASPVVGTHPGERRQEGRGRDGEQPPTTCARMAALLRPPRPVGPPRLRGRRGRGQTASDWRRETSIRRGVAWAWRAWPGRWKAGPGGARGWGRRLGDPRPGGALPPSLAGSAG